MEATKNQRLCITFRDTELQKRYNALFPVPNSQDNFRILLDAYDRLQEFAEKQQEWIKAQQELAETKQKLAESEQNFAELQQKFAEGQQNNAETLQSNAEDLQRIAELEQELAETQQTLAETEQSLAEVQQRLAECEQNAVAQRANDSALFLEPQDWVRNLLDSTAEKLSAKYGHPVTPQMILLDMFLRYTIEQWNMWFYPFVLSDKEIEEASGLTMKQLHEYLNKK